MLLFCVAPASAATTHAQTGTQAGAKQPGAKGKAAAKVSSDLDDFSPRAKSKEKPPGQSDAGNKGKATPDDISDPSAPGAPQADIAPLRAPANSTPAAVQPPRAATSASVSKKAGVTRLCLAPSRTQMSTGDAAQAAEAVRNTFKSLLTGPTIETTSLTARLPSQVFEEAKQGGCDYVLQTSLTHKKGGGGLLGRALGDAASSAVWHIPGSGSAAGAVARSAAVSGVYTAASMAGSIKAKDELTLGYKLDAVDGTKPPMVGTEKAKAKSDGDDVLTPLIEKAAQAIAVMLRG